jgi:hypothetical protein
MSAEKVLSHDIRLMKQKTIMVTYHADDHSDFIVLSLVVGIVQYCFVRWKCYNGAGSLFANLGRERVERVKALSVLNV